MKKRFLTLASVCLLALGAGASLASCNKDDSSTSSSSETREDAGDGVNALDMYVPNGEFEHTKAMITKYNENIRAKMSSGELTEDLTVKVTLIDKSEGDVGTPFNADPENCPVIMHVPGNNANSWGLDNKLESLVIKGDETSKTSVANGQLINVPEDAFIADGSTAYALPFTVNTFFLIYNKEVFKTPESLESLETMRQALVEYNTTAAEADKFDYLLEMDFGNGWQMQSFLFQDGQLMQGEGGIVPEDNGMRTNTDAVVKNLMNMNYMLEHSFDKGLGEGKEGPLAFQNTLVSQMSKSAENNCAAFVSGTWDLAGAIKAIGEENVGCAILPNIYDVGDATSADQPFEATQEWTMCQDYKSIAINSAKYRTLSATAKTASKELVKFMLTPEGQKLRYQGTITPAVMEEPLGIPEADNYIAADALAGAARPATTSSNPNGQTFIQPSTVGWNEYWGAATSYYADYNLVTYNDAGKPTKGGTRKIEVWDNVTDFNALRNQLKAGVEAMAAVVDKANGLTQ